MPSAGFWLQTCVFAIIGNDQIFESNNVKLLGITIDNELKFDKHVSDLCLKVNRKLSTLSRLARFLSFDKNEVYLKHLANLNSSIVP